MSVADYPNLKPWPKGVSGNPSGRPKRLPFTRALELALRTRIPENAPPKLKRLAGRKYAVAAAVGLLQRAAEGDPTAFKEARNTIEGPPQDRDDSGPPQIIVNLISIAPQKQQTDAPELVINGEAIGKTN